KVFHEYQRLEPEDVKGKLMADACEQVPHIQPYFQYVDIEEFAQNSEADDNAPVAFEGGIVFSSDRQTGLKLMKEKSGWTGRDYLDVYFSEKQPDGTFEEPRQFSAKLSETNKNTGNTSFTADGSAVYFTRNDNVLNKQETYSLQLYRAVSSGDGDHWKDVEKLPFCAPAYNFMHPAISPDGKYLFFASNKPGGQGGTDLWVAERMGDDWGKPENLGAEINTFANEGFPFVDAKGRLYFCSKGRPGYGGFDIFVSEKEENGNWKTPVNLGKPINSSLDDISIFIAADRRSGIFTSSRSGGDDDIFLFRVLDELPAPEEEIAEEIGKLEEIEATPPTPKGESDAVAQPIVEEVKEVEKGGGEEIVPAPETPSIQPAEEEKTVPQPEPEKSSSQEKQPEPRAQFVENEPEPSPAPVEKPTAEEASAGKNQVQTGQQPGGNLPRSVTRIRSTAEPENTEPEVIEIQTIEAEKRPTQADNEMPESAPEQKLFSFRELSQKLETGSLYPGESFRLDGAVFDPNIWQLTPHVVASLDNLIALLNQYPSLGIELSAHTESLGIDQENLKLSENRAAMALDYLLREGIAKHRITAKGYGETMPLNRCRNGVTCSSEEHLYNQRLEVRVVSE
ncbi:MAG: OmpA family protein, partial [Bacteroidota bacterium]